MKGIGTIRILVFFIVALSILATLTGIFSRQGPGPFEFESIHGETIIIHGRGIYRNMSAEVAVQGIAHDYVTLFIGIPFLLIGLLLAGKGSYRGRFLLAGVLSFFLVTYLFYTVMGAYNQLFLVYAALTALSFFGLVRILISFDMERISKLFRDKTPAGLLGGFLIFQAVMVAALWFSIVLPPLFDGSIIPVQVEHYTTLVVQGLDLGLLLPIAAVSGILLIKRRPYGFLAGSVFLIFLAFLMTALTGKIIGQQMTGIDTRPALFIIPLMNLIAIFCAILTINNIRPEQTT